MDPVLFWTVGNEAILEVYEKSDTVEEWSFQGVDVDEAEESTLCEQVGGCRSMVCGDSVNGRPVIIDAEGNRGVRASCH